MRAGIKRGEARRDEPEKLQSFLLPDDVAQKLRPAVVVVVVAVGVASVASAAAAASAFLQVVEERVSNCGCMLECVCVCVRVC